MRTYCPSAPKGDTTLNFLQRCRELFPYTHTITGCYHSFSISTYLITEKFYRVLTLSCISLVAFASRQAARVLRSQVEKFGTLVTWSFTFKVAEMSRRKQRVCGTSTEDSFSSLFVLLASRGEVIYQPHALTPKFKIPPQKIPNLPSKYIQKLTRPHLHGHYLLFMLPCLASQ